MARHYVLIDDATTTMARLDLVDLGTDLNVAFINAGKAANYLTDREIKNRDAFELIACDVPVGVYIDDDNFSWFDYSFETIIDYRGRFLQRTYCVANDAGDLAGHGFDLEHAEQCLSAMQEKEPDAGWKIICCEL